MIKDELDEKSIFLKKDGEIVGLHSVGYAGHYKYTLIGLDGTEIEKESNFDSLESWGNEYDESYNILGRGSFRIFGDIEEAARDLENDGWLRFERK